jgi:hypothetical protein
MHTYTHTHTQTYRCILINVHVTHDSATPESIENKQKKTAKKNHYRNVSEKGMATDDGVSEREEEERDIKRGRGGGVFKEITKGISLSSLSFPLLQVRSAEDASLASTACVFLRGWVLPSFLYEQG